jgi:glycosyltransferase involved in cell wall biosynthesis
MYKVSLIIPCYNEANNLPLLINHCAKVFTNDTVQVVLVNNGSSDNSEDVMKDLMTKHSFIRMVKVDTNAGYGNGILAGLRTSKTKILAWTHADMQTDPTDILEGLKIINTENHQFFIKGKRFGRPLIDVLFTIGMSLFETLFLRKIMWDINAQPTIFSRKFFDTWQDPPNDFSLDLFAYYQAKISGLEIRRFNVYFGKRAHGTSHWNISWVAKINFIKRTLIYSFKLRKKLKSNV